MANSWLRLWHSLPTDPKFRTVAKIANQPIALVLSVYIYLLCEASENVTRGVTQCNAESVATNFDVTIEAVESIFVAMEGRLLDGNKIKNWDKRQVVREDNSLGRVRLHREKKKKTEQNPAPDVTASALHCVTERYVTNVTTDKDKDKEILLTTKVVNREKNQKLPNCPYDQIVNLYHEKLPSASRIIALSPTRKRHIQARWKENPDLKIFEMLFQHVAESPFLLGQVQSPGRTPFKITIDWIMNPNNFLKILEGRYFE